jgi:hypothetical protein
MQGRDIICFIYIVPRSTQPPTRLQKPISIHSKTLHYASMSEQTANLPYTALILGAHKLNSGLQKIKYRKLVVLTLNYNFVLDTTSDTQQRVAVSNGRGLKYNFVFLKTIKSHLSNKLRVFEKRR